jgi:hypothetical protein
MAATLKEQMASGKYAAAQKTWTDQLDLIDSRSDSVVSTFNHRSINTLIASKIL